MNTKCLSHSCFIFPAINQYLNEFCNILINDLLFKYFAILKPITLFSLLFKVITLFNVKV